MILGLSSAKGYSFFLIGGVFPLAYYLKDYFKTYEANYHYSKPFKINYHRINDYSLTTKYKSQYE